MHAQGLLEAVYGRLLVRAPGLTLECIKSHSNEVTKLMSAGSVHIKEREAKPFRRVHACSHTGEGGGGAGGGARHVPHPAARPQISSATRIA